MNPQIPVFEIIDQDGRLYWTGHSTHRAEEILREYALSGLLGPVDPRPGYIPGRDLRTFQVILRERERTRALERMAQGVASNFMDAWWHHRDEALRPRWQPPGLAA